MPSQSIRASFSAIAAICIVANGATAFAHPGGWGGPVWGPVDGPADHSRRMLRDRSREGRIEVSRFVADETAAQALGHGPVAVTSNSAGDEFTGEAERAPFEAAVIDRLVHAGYDTARPDPQAGQVAELRVTRTQIESAEARRKPVSGEVAMEVGNRGTAYGMALNVDLTKPLPPLVSTRLEARILDQATHQVLWEGRADIATREGDAHWTTQEIAARLAEALFDGFPRPG